jgi:hypothetical protein
MPLGAELPQRRRPEPLLALADPGASVTVAAETANDYCFEVHAPLATAAQFRQYFFFGWTAEIDGRPAAITREGKLGTCELHLPAGDHELRIWFKDTPLRRAAKWVAGACLALVIGLLLAPRRPALTRVSCGAVDCGSLKDS